MDSNGDSSENDSIDWNSDDEIQISAVSSPQLGSTTSSHHQAIGGFQESNTSSNINGSSSSSKNMVHHFVRMGFSKELVVKAIQENGEADEESILDSILTYMVLERSEREHVPQSCHFEEVTDSCDDHSDEDSSSKIDANYMTDSSSSKVPQFVKMGFSEKLAMRAIEENGDKDDASILDFLLIHTTTKEDFPCKKIKLHQNQSSKGQGSKGKEKNFLKGNGDIFNLPKPMIGFGIPDQPWKVTQRKLHDTAVSRPYFYYENVALTPKGVWSKISRFLYDIKPEFVDSTYFCAAARKRGYVHNLPIQNRFPLLPRPPLTIHEALPSTKQWWPSWDKRTKLNCLLTTHGSAKLTERIRKRLEDCDCEPTPRAKKYVLDECKRWNLVWVGKNKVAPLEPDEMEMLLGFPKDHTRGIGNRSDRYKALGNSFQVDTVAYHLSVLKKLFPYGINVLSLFSGIGGAEVALGRLGIQLNNVVSVEISEVNREILRSWWQQTNQKGTLIEFEDVQEVDGDSIETWIKLFGGFDLVIGGSPCNNLSGGNRRSRDGLEGEHSSLFYHYFRILEMVRSIMGNR